MSLSYQLQKIWLIFLKVEMFIEDGCILKRLYEWLLNIFIGKITWMDTYKVWIKRVMFRRIVPLSFLLCTLKKVFSGAPFSSVQYITFYFLLQTLLTEIWRNHISRVCVYFLTVVNRLNDISMPIWLVVSRSNSMTVWMYINVSPIRARPGLFLSLPCAGKC